MLDYLIQNATVVDGTGAAGYLASVGVKGDKIAAIITEGELPEAKTVIDAKGRILAPGFIDAHSHVDAALPLHPDADNNIMQGITTAIAGNCGLSLAPAQNAEFIDFYLKKNMLQELKPCWKSFAEWLDYIRSFPIGVNYAPLVGHNALRGSVLGMDYQRPSTAEEVEQIVGLLEEALDAGAFGMTYIMDPGQVGHCAARDEMLALFKKLEERDSFVSAHTRHHQNQWPSDDGRNYYGVYVGEPGDVICGRYLGFVEFMELFKETPKLTAAYSHLTNAFMAPMPHSQELENAMLDETLRKFVDEPAAEGYQVYFNVLVHEHSLSGIRKVTQELTRSFVFDKDLKDYAEREVLLANLPDRAFRERVKTYVKSGKFKMNMISPATDPYWADCFTFFTAKDASLLNRTLMDITLERMPGIEAEVIYNNCLEVLFDLLLEDPDLEWALTRDKREYMGTNRLLANPRGMPMSDAGSFPEKSDKWLNTMGYGNPPLAYTTMVRYLVDVCREGKAMSMEEAIRRMTSGAAEMVGIADRGRIAEGLQADLVLLDWEKLGYTIDFNNPSKQPEGIHYVWVNGVPALAEGKLTHALNGRVLTHG